MKRKFYKMTTKQKPISHDDFLTEFNKLQSLKRPSGPDETYNYSEKIYYPQYAK